MKLNCESKKILVLGSPGAGKTFFSNILSKKIGIETIHLDDYYWLDGWKHLNDYEWNDLLIMLLERDRYIMDGNYIESLDLRIDYVDTIIYIDCSLLSSIKGIIIRHVKNVVNNEKELPKNVMNGEDVRLTEKGIVSFILYIVKYYRVYRHDVLKKIQSIQGKKVYVIKHYRKMRFWDK